LFGNKALVWAWPAYLQKGSLGKNVLPHVTINIIKCLGRLGLVETTELELLSWIYEQNQTVKWQSDLRPFP